MAEKGVEEQVLAMERLHFFIEISEKNHLFSCPGVSYPAGCVSLAGWILTKLAA